MSKSSNEKLLKNLLRISDQFLGAVEKGVNNTTKEILKESTQGMKRFGRLIRVSKTGKPYYTTRNTSNTLRVLTGNLKGSLVAASKGSNLDGGIYKASYIGDDYNLVFGSSVVDDNGESYPRKHDNSKFAFLQKRLKGDRYIQDIRQEVNKIWH